MWFILYRLISMDYFCFLYFNKYGTKIIPFLLILLCHLYQVSQNKVHILKRATAKAIPFIIIRFKLCRKKKMIEFVSRAKTIS